VRDLLLKITGARSSSAANYFPVNSIISLDDGKAELAVISDVSVGGSSLRDGQLELMLHRRIQVDDSRGVQEPLNETMCGCNDIHAQPGQMGEHGQEADGGCECAGLTIRGKHVLIFDTVDNAHKLRRQLVESLSFPPTIAFSSAGSKGSGIKPVSFLSQSLPANIKLLTLTDNYASHNNGTILLRLAHLYAAGEHSTLSLPATVSLRTVFASKKLLVVAATEMSLTANQEAVAMDARRAAVGSDPWNTGTVGGNRKRLDPRDATLSVVIQPMEVRTFLVKLG
jgi:alpha-mannosidase